MIAEQRVIDVMNAIPWDNSFIKNYVGMHYERTDAPLAYALGGALSLLSSNAHEDLCVYFGGRVNANLWMLYIGPSGWSRKSTSVNIARDLQNVVNPGRVGTDPGSVQGLLKSVASAPVQTLYIEELGDFLSQTAEAGYAKPLRENLVRLYDGNPYNKVFSETVYTIDKPRVSINAGVTEQYLEQFTAANDWEGGLMGRWSPMAGRPERYMAMPARRQDLFDHCASQLEWIGSKLAVACGGLEDDAIPFWNTWSGMIQKMSITHPDQWVSAAGARIQTFAARAAMLLCLDAGMDLSRPWKMPLVILKIAIEIAHMFYDSLVYVVGELCSTKFARERRTVLRTFQRVKLREERELLTLKDILLFASPRMELRAVKRVLETLLAEESVFLRAGGAYSLYAPTEEETKVVEATRNIL